MEAGGVVPESVTEVVNRSSNHFEEFRAHFTDFLPLCDAHTLFQLDHLRRAQSLLLLAKATTTLFTLKLRCNGVDPEDDLTVRCFKVQFSQPTVQPLQPQEVVN